MYQIVPQSVEDRQSLQEVDYIFKLPKEFFDLYLKELMENNVQIRFMGHLEMAPQQTRDIILSAIEKTKNSWQRIGELNIFVYLCQCADILRANIL